MYAEKPLKNLQGIDYWCKLLAKRELYNVRDFGKEKLKRKSIFKSSFLRDCMLEALGIFEGVDGSLEYIFVKKDYDFPLQS